MAKTASRTLTYPRALLKLTGESLCEAGSWGVDPQPLRRVVEEVAAARALGAQLAIVVGGGNMIRGGPLSKQGMLHQATADAMGMLGTIINALALREALSSAGVGAVCFSSREVEGVAARFDRVRALEAMARGDVVVLGGGTGNPYFTTDSAAALRAAELDCTVILKATKVDGVYSADPRKDPAATRFASLTFAEAIERRLGVMDLTALAMCEESGVPVLVFDFFARGSVAGALGGEAIGTLVSRDGGRPAR